MIEVMSVPSIPVLDVLAPDMLILDISALGVLAPGVLMQVIGILTSGMSILYMPAVGMSMLRD